MPGPMSSPQKQVEAEVLGGLRHVLDLCADPRGFTAKVNRELRPLWEESIGFRPDAAARISAIDQKIARVRQAVEDGLNDAKWANYVLGSRLNFTSAKRLP